MGEEHERGDSIDRARAAPGCGRWVVHTAPELMAAAQQLSLRLGIRILVRMQHAQGVLRGKRCQRRQGFAACFRLGVHHELQQESKAPDVRAKPRSSAAMVRCGAPSSQYCRMIRAGLRAVEMAQRDDGFPLQPA